MVSIAVLFSFMWIAIRYRMSRHSQFHEVVLNGKLFSIYERSMLRLEFAKGNSY